MPTHNNLEQSILDMYTDIHLGSCYESLSVRIVVKEVNMFCGII